MFSRVGTAIFIMYYLLLFKIINAAITPGTQPHKVSRNTMRNEPHPLSTTAKGGKNIAKITLINDINICAFYLCKITK